jgi:hypothetical protein
MAAAGASGGTGRGRTAASGDRLMPSSGARSGTKPSRLGRGVGDPRAGATVTLQCGCETAAPPGVSNPRRWFCDLHGGWKTRRK